MKHYYAVFHKTKNAVEVEFPDLAGCVTFGATWEEAFDNAEDALAVWLVNPEPEFIKTASTHSQLEHITQGTLVPIAVNETIMASYQKLKRFNVIFPADVLKKIDSYRKKKGLKRSTFLQKAAEEYLQHHDR